MADLGCGKKYMTLKCETIRFNGEIIQQTLCSDCRKLKDASLGVNE